ncbi:hypothetical protein A3L11_03575 [Thermococcus siculi]|uniref:Uncharacterized protein n=1 Tax=Thermococcus siculi TaxID=72803 RepID=A0A2Z2MWU6_9EURY|nr:hypothetical protein [Thermococcus siculi]ASJ08360.1 hypothetical protein A3L11_03575 [Thermococcus siculi]
MIGLMAALLTGIVLKQWVFALAVIPYLLRLKGRNPALIAFYAYVMVIALTVPGESLYTHSGLVSAVSVSVSTFLLLDEVLRGVKLDRVELIISGILLVSAVYDYAFVAALVGVSIYLAYLRFGRVVYYLLGWFGVSSLALYLLGDTLPDRVAQSFVIIGLGLIFLLLAERKDVEFLEVRLLEEE